MAVEYMDRAQGPTLDFFTPNLPVALPPCATDPHSHPDKLTPGTVGKPLARPFDGVFGSVGRLAVPRWRSLASADGWRAVPRGGSRWCGIGQLRAVRHTSVCLSIQDMYQV